MSPYNKSKTHSIETLETNLKPQNVRYSSYDYRHKKFSYEIF
jgi:hypothetical protein